MQELFLDKQQFVCLTSTSVQHLLVPKHLVSALLIQINFYEFVSKMGREQSRPALYAVAKAAVLLTTQHRHDGTKTDSLTVTTRLFTVTNCSSMQFPLKPQSHFYMTPALNCTHMRFKLIFIFILPSGSKQISLFPNMLNYCVKSQSNLGFPVVIYVRKKDTVSESMMHTAL